MRKVVALLLAVLLGALMASQWQDILRYVKIRRLSAGGGHPGNVPAEGRKVYPRTAAHGTPDGAGDFDSAARGGPAGSR